MSSLYSSGLHSHQMSIQQSSFGMWWNGRLASWMCSWQICSNCVMLSCRYGTDSLRNVSSITLNLCHGKIKAVLKAKGGPTRYCKVSLIKWPASVCILSFKVLLFSQMKCFSLISVNAVSQLVKVVGFIGSCFWDLSFTFHCFPLYTPIIKSDKGPKKDETKTAICQKR